VSGVANVATNVIAQVQTHSRAPDKFIARSGLFRRSAVVRGAVDTGCRRNNTVGSAEQDEIDYIEEEA
jgi:hypothetical protein